MNEATPISSSIEVGGGIGTNTPNRALLAKYLKELDPTEQYLYGQQLA